MLNIFKSLAVLPIERMIADAEQFAAEDKKRREVTQVKNEADTLIYETLTAPQKMI